MKFLNISNKNIIRSKHLFPLKCQQMVEENEENIENWYFHKQNSDPDMHLWLCVEKLQVCCKEGFFGKNCKPCPGVDKGLNSCFGRGKCHVIFLVFKLNRNILILLDILNGVFGLPIGFSRTFTGHI